MPRPDHVTGAPARLTFVSNEHEAILQTLERKSNGLFLPLDSYDPTVGEWTGIPLIYAQNHPDPEAYDKDPEAELKRIGGRLVGTCNDAWIDRTGHPRLMGALGVTDQEVEDGIEDGIISLSTGLRNLRPKGDRLEEAARPHHILLFREGGKDMPGDLGTFILNQKEKGSDMADDEKELVARLRALFMGRQGPDGRKGEEVENMAEVKELEAKLATLTAAERQDFSVMMEFSRQALPWDQRTKIAGQEKPTEHDKLIIGHMKSHAALKPKTEDRFLLSLYDILQTYVKRRLPPGILP